MRRTWFQGLLLLIFCVVVGFATNAYGQFSSNVQGVVSDTSGAVVPSVTVQLMNVDTKVIETTVTGQQGEFRFVSLAPGPYEITASAKGFATHKVSVQLLTEQTMNVPFTLNVSSQSTTVEPCADHYGLRRVEHPNGN